MSEKRADPSSSQPVSEQKTQAQLRKEAKSQKAGQTQLETQSTPTPIRQTRLDRFARSLVDRVLALPRMSRVMLSVVFALAVILAVRPIIDMIYLDYIYAQYPETNMLPTWIATIVGIIMYVAGWRLIVGITGEVLPVRRAVFYYLFIGIGALVLNVALIIHGLITVGIEV